MILLPLRWFNEDFLPAVGIDVYGYAFNLSDGFGQIEAPGFNIMLYRYEDLEQMQSHLACFVDRPEFSLEHRSATEEKDIPPNVLEVLNEGRNLIPTTLVDRIYGTRYAQHFGYSSS